MAKAKGRFLGLLLALCLAAALLPAAALAGGGSLTVLSSVSAVDVTAPVAGAVPQTTATAGGLGCTVSDVWWFQGNTSQRAGFSAGGVYQVRVRLVPQTGYVLAAEGSLTAAVNGEKAEIFRYDGASVGVVIAYTFPAAKTVSVPAAEIYVQPAGRNARPGESVTLTVSAGGTGTLSYLWYSTPVNDIATIRADLSATANRYTIPDTTGTAYYCVAVWNTVGGVQSEPTYSALVAVSHGTAPVITVQPAAQTVRAGSSAAFAVAASGDGLHYQWYCATVYALTPVGADSPVLTVSTDESDVRADGTAAAEYCCEVSNAAGTVTSARAALTVRSAAALPFADVPAGKWFYGYVKSAWDLGLVDGKTDTAFCPADTMTCAEAIKVAACMYQKYHEGSVTLTGASASPWYAAYVDYARAHGIPADFENYGAPVTRRDYVRIFYCALPASEYGKLNIYNTIPDVSRSDAAWTEIHAFYEAGIVEGYDGGYFRPNETITRAEVSAVLSRMMDSSLRVSASA